MNDEWIPLATALEISEMSSGTFTYHVRRGRVRALRTEGLRDARYNVSDILLLKKEHPSLRRRGKAKQQQKETPKKSRIIVDWVQPGDIPAALKLAQERYGGEIDLAEAAVYQSWRKNNNLLSMGAFTEDRSKCYATVQLVPLIDERIALDILSGARKEVSIHPDEIPGYDRPGPYTLLATSAVVHEKHRYVLGEVLKKIMDFWLQQYPERYITRIYAQAVSVDGQIMVQHMFMSPLYGLAPNAYMLDMSVPSASKIMRRFQLALEQKAPLPESLRSPYAGIPAPIGVSPPVGSKRLEKAPQSPKRPDQHTGKNALETHRPKGAITYLELAGELGISRSTMAGHLERWEREAGRDDCYTKIAHPTRNETLKYFTPEQREAFLHWRRTRPTR